MPPLSKRLHLFLNWISFFWLLLTTSSALLITRPFSHPQWTIVTIAPLILMNLYWVRHLPQTIKLDPDFSSRRYLILFGLIAALMTGLAAQMGFLPFFFHELIVWPLIIVMVWDFVKCIRYL